jgi:hypothetical protein
MAISRGLFSAFPNHLIYGGGFSVSSLTMGWLVPNINGSGYSSRFWSPLQLCFCGLRWLPALKLFTGGFNTVQASGTPLPYCSY